jgi:hypothetical protein
MPTTPTVAAKARYAALCLVALGAMGCSSKTYLNKPGQRVAVLPPFHLKEDAWKTTWHHVEVEVQKKGYLQVPRDTVTGFMKDKGFTLPNELETYSAAELAEELNADFVLYTKITEWDRTTLLAYTSVVVELQAALRSASGELLWSGEGTGSDRDATLSVRGAIRDTAKAALGGRERVADDAARECFEELPYCGMTPADD